MIISQWDLKRQKIWRLKITDLSMGSLCWDLRSCKLKRMTPTSAWILPKSRSMSFRMEPIWKTSKTAKNAKNGAVCKNFQVDYSLAGLLRSVASVLFIFGLRQQGKARVPGSFFFSSFLPTCFIFQVFSNFSPSVIAQVIPINCAPCCRPLAMDSARQQLILDAQGVTGCVQV